MMPELAVARRRRADRLAVAVMAECRWPFAIAALHGLVFDFTVYWISSAGALGRSLAGGALAAVGALPFAYLCQWLGRPGRVAVALVFFVDGIAAYLVLAYRIDIRADTLSLLYHTEADEVTELVGVQPVLWSLACLVTPFAFWRWLGPVRPALDRRQKLWLLTALLAIGYGATQLRGGASVRLPAQMPYSIVQGSLELFREEARLRKIAAHAIDLGKLGATAAEADVTAVLVIGEAARADHFSLNGYGRQTNPELERLPVVSFRDVTACADKTHLAVPCILTRRAVPSADDLVGESSFIRVFSAAGFDTAWISNARRYNPNDTVATAIAGEARRSWMSRERYVPATDGTLEAPFAATLARAPQLIVLHTRGSHWEYAMRSDAAHRVFRPVCTASVQWHCDGATLVNAYDDSIVYTDAFLAGLIRRLAARNAFLIYVSDHGESLGEDGYFGHGQGVRRPEQLHVPMLFWASEAWRSRHPERLEAVRRHAPLALGQAVVFHSMLDCAGVSSPALDRRKSICT
jgi:glucan phosphoethanolaminetransferase (alkaline phosphatase superfamily)